jgi:hypothetical protein
MRCDDKFFLSMYFLSLLRFKYGRDEIQKQSAESKKRARKYKDIIKNGELCLMISIEITQEEYKMGKDQPYLNIIMLILTVYFGHQEKTVYSIRRCSYVRETTASTIRRTI